MRRVVSSSLPFSLLLITDRRAVEAEGRDAKRALVEKVEAALRGTPPGSMAVMLREKDLSGGPLLGLCRMLQEVTGAAGAPLLVNDRVDVALAAGACGVHLPSSGLPPKAARELLGENALIGVSTHTMYEVRRAVEEGADYVTFGPVFDTPSKRPYGPPVGLEALFSAATLPREGKTPLPVVALGGITSERHVREAVEAKAGAVAFIRAVLQAEDPAGKAASFLAAVAESSL